MDYEKVEKIVLKSHPTLDEKWLQDRIAEDPAILGFGEVFLRDRERIQAGAGRLDLLFQSEDDDEPTRYEVEIQLGKTDESHIIRTIEYWDIERKRYPQYKHCAVIVAEEITGRFLNVIGLFGGSIPLIALQVSALKVKDSLTLLFTRVVDEIVRGGDDEAPDPVEVADRAYWEKRNKPMLDVVDGVVGILKTFDSTLEPSYNKGFIGLSRQGRVNNFVVFIHRKNSAPIVGIKLPQSDDLDKKCEESGFQFLPYNRRYRPRISKADFATHGDFIRSMLEMSYKYAIE